MVLASNASAWLAECLDALAVQSRRPDRLLILDLGSTDTTAAIATAHARVRERIRDVRVERTETELPEGAAVDLAIRALPSLGESASENEWLWILRDAAPADRDTLRRLLGGVSRTVGIAGPKIVAWNDRRRLVELGIQVTRTGRRIASPARGEADQGQHDTRSDVLAVRSSGMLLRRSVHDDLGGFDPAFNDAGSGLDLGWRAQLADHRVVVVPSAVVRDATSTAADGVVAIDPGAERSERRAQRRIALTRCSPLAMPFLALWMVLSSIGASSALLVAKRPRLALREFSDLGALARPFSVFGARWRARRTKRLKRRDLTTLFVGAGTAARSTVGHIQEAITPESVTARKRRRELGAEPGPIAEEAEGLETLPASAPRRVATNPGVIAAVLAAATSVVAWRGPIGNGALSPSGSGMAGGELFPVAAGSEDLWHGFRDVWTGSGLGAPSDGSPAMAVLSGLTWLAERLPAVAASRSSAAVVIAWLLVLAPVLATWTAYLAGRTVTPSRVARGFGAFVWGTSSLLLLGVSEGRLPIAMSAIFIPPVLAGFVLAARRQASFTAAFATALAIAVLGAFVPAWLLLTSAAAVLLVIFGPGLARARALVLLLVPLGLLGPWLMRFVDDWRLVFSGPGLVTGQSAPHSALDLALLNAGNWPGWWAFTLVPVLLVALGAYAVRVTGRGRAVGLIVLSVVGLVGLVTAAISGQVVLGTVSSTPGRSALAHPWIGVGWQVWLAATVAGLMIGLPTLIDLAAHRGPTWRRVAAGIALAVVILPTIASAARWAVAGTGDELSARQSAVPAIAIEQAAPPLGNRLLVLRPSDTVTDFVLIGREPGQVLRDIDQAASSDLADSALAQQVATLVGGLGTEAPDAKELARWGIGFVELEGAPSDPMAVRLDAAAGLSRLGADDQRVLWKVAPPAVGAGVAPLTAPSRLLLTDAKGSPLSAVAVTGPHAGTVTTIAPGAADRRLVVAEPLDWAAHARVSLNGQVLMAIQTGAVTEFADRPTYAIPASGGELQIALDAADPWWRLGQGVLLLVAIFMALPFGNRRSRRSR